MNALNPTPINKTAALVVSRGWHFSPSMAPSACRETWDVPPYALGKTPPHGGSKNILGAQRGFLTVVSYVGGKRSRYGAPETAQGGRWLVRCACGRYEIRRGRNMRKPEFDACALCFQERKIMNRKPKKQKKSKCKTVWVCGI